MTHHLTAGPLTARAAPRAGGPALAGITSALLGLAITAVPVLALWVLSATPQDSAADAARLAGALWLLGHGGPLARGGTAPLSLTPLALTLAVLLLVRRAAGRAAGTVGVRRGSVPAVLCTGYLLVALPVALFCQGAGVLRAQPLPDLAAVALLVYGTAAAGARTRPAWWSPSYRWAVRQARGLTQRLAARLPAAVTQWLTGRRPALLPGPAVVRAATGGVLTLLAGGALLFGTVVVLRTDATDPVVRELAGNSVSGLLGLLLSCLLLAPDAVLCAVGYALGPGFALGTGTAVAPGTVRLGAVPDFPLFALVPSSGSGWQWLALLVPLAAGVVVATLLGREASPVAHAEAEEEEAGAESEEGPAPQLVGPAGAALAAAGAAVLVGVAVAVAGWLAGGAVGGGRMAALGPAPGCGPAAAGWIAAVAVPGAAGLRWWQRHRADRAAAPLDPLDAEPAGALPVGTLPLPAQQNRAGQAGARLLDWARRRLGRS
ncbi:hypothetical protein C7C46_17400 [Streptomyces tateyamensis]|uniref:Integral membrane protein n=1 Tax=Streptomyces tateyamensis TaxID=565073 RepID=A0A2V4N592_9ACTN|nr:DUF6350 family protein [Streptomyces tateyamensis]PYC78104.1 hypothetical protein C7C46_17400 [Streptomyces tateyamensis]